MFTREYTKIFKGIAVILMMAHHLLFFPERMPTGYEIISMVSVNGLEIETIIGSFGKICVSLFMFLGGYGMWKQAEASKDGSVSILKHILSLYTAFWKILLVFAPIAFIFFGNQPIYSEKEAQCTLFSNFTIDGFIRNFTGWHTSYNWEWWFFKSYICTLFIGALFMTLIRKHQNKYTDIFILIIWEIMSTVILPALPKIELLSGLNSDIFYKNIFLLTEYSISFYAGIIVAKYSLLDRFIKMYMQLSIVPRVCFAILSQLLVIYSRVFFNGSASMDILYIPIFISSGVIILEAIPIAKKALKLFGKYSTSIWLTHSFFCYYFYTFSKIVYYTRNGIIALITLTAFSLLASILVEHFWKNPLFKRIYSHCNNH